MPGQTPLGIRYPLYSEVVSADVWQNMADDIEGILSTIDGYRAQLLTPPTGVVASLSTSITVNTPTVATFTFEEIESDLADLGANNDRFTVPSGIWMMGAYTNLSGFTTVTSFRISLTVNGTTIASNKLPNISGTPPIAMTVQSVVPAATNNTILRTSIHWTGTGGPATGSTQMWVFKLRNYPAA
jgi:hypothetical protein